jgi:hypothetical protein
LPLDPRENASKETNLEMGSLLVKFPLVKSPKSSLSLLEPTPTLELELELELGENVSKSGFVRVVGFVKVANPRDELLLV